MKNILYTLLLFSSLAFSQSSGITYQAVIYNPNGEELPGVDNPYAPLANQDVCLQFGIVDADGNVEYQEEVQVTTDAFGMVNLLIGTNTQTGGYAADFAGIEWSADAKFLKVDLDIKGNCTDFEELSYQPFTYVPFAYYSPTSDVPGPEGPQGPAGANGQDGAEGLQGPTGPAGSTGQAGPAGPNGQDGATGPAGPSGPEGPQGDSGEAGIKTLINTSDEAAGDNCVSGGVKIEVGEDTNADGILDTDEVDDSLTRYVCNGADGEDGSDGQDGGGSSGLNNGGVFSSSKLFSYGGGHSLSADGSRIAIIERFYSNGSPNNQCSVSVYQIGGGSLTRIGQEIIYPFSNYGAYTPKLNFNGTEMWVNEGFSTLGTTKKYLLSQNQWIIEAEFSAGSASYGNFRFSDDLQTKVSKSGDISKFVNGTWVSDSSEGIVYANNLYHSGFDVNSDGTLIAFSSSPGNSTNNEISVYQKINDNWQIAGNTITDNDSPGLKHISISNEEFTIAFSSVIDQNQDGSFGYNERVIKVYEFDNGSWIQKGNNINLTSLGDINTSLTSLKIHNNGNSISCLSNISISNSIDADQLISFSFDNGDWGANILNFQDSFSVLASSDLEPLSAEVDIVAFFVEAFENAAGGLFKLILYSIN